MIRTVEDGLSYMVKVRDASVLDDYLNSAVDLARQYAATTGMCGILVTRHSAEGGITPIGWQASDIIDSILDDPSPDLADVKLRLVGWLDANPGSPERALLAHLMETSELANSDGEERQP